MVGGGTVWGWWVGQCRGGGGGVGVGQCGGGGGGGDSVGVGVVGWGGEVWVL